MNVIDEVRRDREDLARVLKKHSGIRKLLKTYIPIVPISFTSYCRMRKTKVPPKRNLR